MSAATARIRDMVGYHSRRAAHVFDRKISDAHAFKRRTIHVVAILDLHGLPIVDGRAAALVVRPEKPEVEFAVEELVDGIERTAGASVRLARKRLVVPSGDSQRSVRRHNASVPRRSLAKLRRTTYQHPRLALRLFACADDRQLDAGRLL